ncbi:MAG: prenyltransferase [Pyrinomonadaceae bacterium]
MPDLRFIKNVSRPRFWIYVFGPYLVGLAAGAAARDDLFRIEDLLFGLYFLLPANLLIYGVNDIFDWETDRLNPKKAEYEMLVQPGSHLKLWLWIAVLNIPFIAAAAYLTPQALSSLAGFLVFAVFYSSPPVRAKAIPIVDSIFNVLYVFPGAFAYQMLTGTFPPLSVFAAAWLWTMAMHAYSAIPDIDADREARLNTVATLLGRSGTLLFCLVMYVGSGVLAFPYLGFLALPLTAVYLLMIALSFIASGENKVFVIYRYFPLVNASVGFVLFWSVAWKLLGL